MSDGARSCLSCLAMLAAGAALRLYQAWLTFLNPDEALHYFVSLQPSVKAAYQASLTTAHPPLMILFLHHWIKLGSSELFLRLPFVAAGVLFCWVMFLWVRHIAGSSAGAYALALAAFLPSLIFLSAEVRQYSFLLLFCAICLHALELAIERDSPRWMVASEMALYLALLTHYSALIFAAAVGIYGVVLILRKHARSYVLAIWVAGKAGTLALIGLLYETQIAPLRQQGVPSEIGSTWLSNSIFQSEHDHLISFTLGRTVRLFRYFFTHGTIGVLALLLFLSALAFLCLGRDQRLRNRGLALFLAAPFFLALAAGLAGIYPYGGTRHDVVLVIFAIAGIAVGLARLPVPRRFARLELKPWLLAGALVISNLFPSPTGPYMQPRDQRRGLMRAAIAWLQSSPPDTAMLTDYQSALVLNYYLCPSQPALPFGKRSDELLAWRCGAHEVFTSIRGDQGFGVSELTLAIQRVRAAARGRAVILFQSGWINDKPQEWVTALSRAGCEDIRNFGRYVRTCKIISAHE